MNKQEFIMTIVEEEGISIAEAARSVDYVFRALQKQLENGKEIKIRNFGTFCVKTHQTKMYKDFKTGVEKVVPAHLRPVFIASDALKKRIRERGDTDGNTDPSCI